MNQGLSRIVFPLTTALLIFAGLPLQADTYYVGVDRTIFFPATKTINVGDTIIWVNLDINGDVHSTVSTLPAGNANYWSHILFDVDEEFAHAFNQAGTFTYYDQFDAGTGTIIVQVPVMTPVISLEAPRQEGSQFLFDATGLTVGKTNVLQASTNLTSWTTLKTNVAIATTLTFTNSTALPRRFFRLLELP